MSPPYEISVKCSACGVRALFAGTMPETSTPDIGGWARLRNPLFSHAFPLSPEYLTVCSFTCADRLLRAAAERLFSKDDTGPSWPAPDERFYR